MSVTNAVLPGTIGPESLPFIFAILIIAFVVSTLLDRRKKRKEK